MRILVRSPNWIGDQVIAYPFFSRLREVFPGARIAVACKPWVASLQFRHLVDEVHIIPKPSRGGLLARLEADGAAAAAARTKGGWDLGISLPPSFSAAWFLWRAGARRRRGYAGDLRSWLLTGGDRLPRPGAVLHRAQEYLQLVPGQGLLPLGEITKILEGFDPEKAFPSADALLPPEEAYWVLAPGAVAESRRWPLERFVELGRLVERHRGWRGVVVGGASEKVLADELSRAGNYVDATGGGEVSRIWKLLRGARVTVANDSGLAHLAALCGSPVHVTWGAGDPRKTRPLGPGRVTVTHTSLECWPCEKNRCEREGEGHVECLKGITPEAVWDAIQEAERGHA